MLCTTVDVLPGASYQAIGLVAADDAAAGGKVNVGKLQADLQKQAAGMGAHAVIGVRVAIASAGGPGVVRSVMTGTAIAFLPVTQAQP